MRRQRHVDEQDKDLEQLFRDPIWRISNLYSIRTRDGQIIPFHPRPQQLELLGMAPEKYEHGADDELTELLIKLRGGSPR